MKRFKNAGIAALVLMLSASITWGAFTPCMTRDVLAYDTGSVLTEEGDIASAIDDFEAYKQLAASEISSYAASHPSVRLQDYLTTVDLEGYGFNTTVTYRDNLTSFDSYVQEVWDNIYLIGDMDSFDVYKQEAINTISDHVSGTPSERVTSYLMTTDIMGFPYDTSVSYNSNLSSLDNYLQEIWDNIYLAEDMDRFDAYKQSAIDSISDYLADHPSSAIESYLQTTDIMGFPYNENMSYDSNRSSFDNYMQEIWGNIYTGSDMDRFEMYKQSAVSAINDYLMLNPSTRVSSYLQTTDIMGFPYNTDMSYDSNRSSFDSYIQEVWMNIYIAEDMDRFDMYKQSAISAINDHIMSNPSMRVSSYLQTTDIMGFPYNENMSYDSNRASFDNYVQEIWMNIYIAEDMDSFDAYKRDTIAQISSYANVLNIPAVTDYLDTLGSYLMEYPFNTELSLSDNKRAFTDEVNRVYNDIEMVAITSRFETYKAETLGSADPDTFVTESAWTAYQEVASELRDFPYITNMSYEDNVSRFNAALAARVAQIDIAADIEDINSIFEPINLPTYTFLDGEDGVWDEDSSNASEGLTFRCEGAIASFRGILIDGVEIDPGSYITYEGSTYCVLSEELLAGLTDGEHNLIFIYDDGISEVTHFTTNNTTVQAPVPATQQETSAPATTTTAATTAAEASVTTATTEAAVLGETRETTATTATATESSAQPEVNTVAVPAETSAPAVQQQAAAVSTQAAATGEASNGTAVAGILLIAGAAVIFLTRNRKSISGNN